MSVGLDRLWCTCEAIWRGQNRMVTVSSIKEHPHRLPPPPSDATTYICMQGHLPSHKGQVSVRHNLGHTGVHEALHVCGDKLLIPDSG